MSQLPHETVAVVCAGLGVALFAYVGLVLLLRQWGEYRRQYLEGAAVTLDAMYITMPAQNILYLGLLCTLAVGVLVWLLTDNIGMGLLLGLPAFLTPRGGLYLLKKKRNERFGQQLVDALVNISNSLRAGFSLPQALELVHREMPNPISQEFRLVCQELRLGVPMEEALENLHRRMPLAEVDLMVTAIAIVREVGGNLTEVFDNIAHTIRERHRIEGKIRALTAMGRSQAFVVCMLPLVLGLAMNFITPGMFANMYTRAAGLMLLGLIGVLEFLAILWIRKIMAIDV